MPDPKIQRSLIKKRTDTIEKLSDALTESIAKSEGVLSKSFVKQFVSKLQLDNSGNILNNPHNKRLVASIDAVYSDFIIKQGSSIVNEIIDGIEEMQSLNREYFTGMANKQSIAQIARQVRRDIYEMIGADENGKLTQDGYLNTLMKDPTVKEKLKNQARRSILSGQNINRYRDNVEAFITGDENRMGLLRDFHKETSMDIISQTDRITSKYYADTLGFEFAIYEGNIIKTSREMCRKNAGKVFHISEIEKFNPPVAKPPNYNPFVDLGGYGCRHHLNWISTELALTIRPDIKKFINKAA